MNKLTTLKIDNTRLLKRVKELKRRIEDMKNMKNVDAQIDYFNKDFSDELI
jgi:predicted ATP-grasp superfamily ATP-dependent carboligase